jgi:hypothetical protein
VTTQPLTDHQLDEIEARAAALNTLGLPGGTWTASPRDEKSVLPPEMAHVVEDVLRTKHSLLRSSVGVFGDERHAGFIAHAREDVSALLAEVRRLRDRVAELEGPAIEARSALAALCYDLEDPGSNALGALYLISQATTGVEAPRDEAAQVLASHDAQIMRRCAEFVRDTYSGNWADDAAATLERDADITERGCPGFEKEYQGVSDAKRRLANCKHCGKPWVKHHAAPAV